MIDALQSSGAASSIAILDPEPGLWGTEVLEVPVLGGDDLLPELVRDGVTHFVVGVGGVGDNDPRKRLFGLATSHGLTPLSVVHPAAICSPRATIGGGSVILAAAVVNNGASLGQNVVVNTGAIVEHDCVIGAHAFIATGSRLCGAVSVGIGAHVGAGATVRQEICIGEGAIIGAGAVVIRDVAAWTVVVGVPARTLDKNRNETSGFSRPNKQVLQ